MKRYFYTLATLVMLGTSCIHAQITITNKVFPVKGDTLKYISQNTRVELNMGNVGGGNNWDFSQFTTGNTRNEIYQDPKTSSYTSFYSNADLLLKIGNQEQFFLSSSTRIEGLGFTTNNPFIGDLIPVRYKKRPIAFRAPITFGTQLMSNAEFNLDFGSSIIPDTIINSLPFRFDSIRIQVTNNISGFADGWGNIKIQNKTFEAIREKTTEISDTKLFVKLGFLWLDVTGLVGDSGIDGGLTGGLGKDTSYYYNFYSDARKEVIFSAQYDRQPRLVNVTYANVNNVILNATNDLNQSNTIEIFPNPTMESINLRGLLPDHYIIYIVDQKGSNVALQMSQVTNNENVSLKVDHLTKGQYFIFIRDKRSNIVAHKSFIKL